MHGTGSLDASIAALDTAERSRATRFAFERDRARFVRRRAFVRQVLAHYLGLAPAAIGIRYSSLGKPELELSDGLSFSVSQSEDLTVVAIATHADVGVDVERLRPVKDVLDLAGSLFADAEAERLGLHGQLRNGSRSTTRPRVPR